VRLLNGRQGGPVGVNVRDHQYAHGLLPWGGWSNATPTKTLFKSVYCNGYCSGRWVSRCSTHPMASRQTVSMRSRPTISQVPTTRPCSTT
jgi:hypothetical protein